VLSRVVLRWAPGVNSVRGRGEPVGAAVGSGCKQRTGPRFNRRWAAEGLKRQENLSLLASHLHIATLASIIKQYLYDIQEEGLWESYLDYCQENKETFNQLPKNIKDLVEDYDN